MFIVKRVDGKYLAPGDNTETHSWVFNICEAWQFSTSYGAMNVVDSLRLDDYTKIINHDNLKELHVWACVPETNIYSLLDIDYWMCYDVAYKKYKDAIETVGKLVKEKDIIYTNQISVLVNASEWLRDEIFDAIIIHEAEHEIVFTYNKTDNIINVSPNVTDKELRPEHNLFKMYVAGAFTQEKE